MTTQTLIFIIAGLLTTTSVVSAVVFRSNFKAIETDLEMAKESLDSAHIRVAQMRQLITDDLLPKVEGEIEDLNKFNEYLNELSLESVEIMKQRDSIRQSKKDNVRSLFKDLN
jgi:hypothetical protein